MNGRNKMTTIVNVKACCNDTQEVVIDILDNGITSNLVVLNNSEEWTGYVYEDRRIVISEVYKKGLT